MILQITPPITPSPCETAVRDIINVEFPMKNLVPWPKDRHSFNNKAQSGPPRKEAIVTVDHIVLLSPHSSDPMREEGKEDLIE